MLEDLFTSLTTQEVLDAASTAKNMYGRYGGYSPFQWITGSSCKHPLIDSQFIEPFLSSGDTEDPVVAHLVSDGDHRHASAEIACPQKCRH